jgi:hypothetical protein
LILFDKQGQREEIVIEDPRCINPRELSMLIAKCRQGKVKDMDAIGLSEEQFERIVQALREIGATFDPPERIAPIQPFKGAGLFQGIVTHDVRYFRAIAKIGFLYFLLHSGRFSGLEPEFNAVRRFVRYGEGDNQHFVTKGHGPLAYDPSGRDRPPYYGHVLRTDISREQIAVRVQLFIGHDYVPDWYSVTLSRERHSLYLPSEEFGHYYRYLEPEERAQHDGVTESLTVAKTILLPGVTRRRSSNLVSFGPKSLGKHD